MRLTSRESFLVAAIVGAWAATLIAGGSGGWKIVGYSLLEIAVVSFLTGIRERLKSLRARRLELAGEGSPKDRTLLEKLFLVR